MERCGKRNASNSGSDSCQLFAPRTGGIIGAETPAKRTPTRPYTLLKVPLRITHPIKLAVEHRVIIVLAYLGTRLCRRLMWMLTLWHHLSAVGASDQAHQAFGGV